MNGTQAMEYSTDRVTTVKIPTETHAMLTMRPNEARTARVRAMLVRFAAAEKMKKLFDGFKEEGKL